MFYQTVKGEKNTCERVPACVMSRSSGYHVSVCLHVCMSSPSGYHVSVCLHVCMSRPSGYHVGTHPGQPALEIGVTLPPLALCDGDISMQMGSLLSGRHGLGPWH